MSKVSIELDLSIVQEVIHAKVAPAVDAILARYDIPALIEKELITERKDAGGSHYMRRYMFMDERNVTPYRVIDNVISGEVRKAAEAYVKAAIEADREKIEGAFKKMIRDNPSRLAHALLSSLENALANDWNFELKAIAEVKEPPRSYGD